MELFECKIALTHTHTSLHNFIHFTAIASPILIQLKNTIAANIKTAIILFSVCTFVPSELRRIWRASWLISLWLWPLRSFLRTNTVLFSEHCEHTRTKSAVIHSSLRPRRKCSRNLQRMQMQGKCNQPNVELTSKTTTTETTKTATKRINSARETRIPSRNYVHSTSCCMYCIQNTSYNIKWAYIVCSIHRARVYATWCRVNFPFGRSTWTKPCRRENSRRIKEQKKSIFEPSFQLKRPLNFRID